MKGVPAGEVHLSLEHRPHYVTTVELVEVFPGEITQVSLSMMPFAVFLEELLVSAERGNPDAVVRLLRPPNENVWHKMS